MTTTTTDPAPIPPAVELIPPAFDQLPEVTAFLAAHAEEHDRQASFPFDGVERVHRAGLLTATVGERHGGAGVRLAGTVRILRALGAGDPSVALVSAMTLFTHALQDSNPTWPQEYYRRLLAESSGAPALVNALRVEPDLGTPARGGLPATTARADGGDWVLTGRKIFSTGAPGLRWLAVWARTDEEPPRVGSFLVPADTAGLSVEPTWDHLGLRASGSHDVILDRVRIPREATAGLADPVADPRRDPALIAWNNLGLTALYLGVAEAARDWLIGFLHERTPSALGRPLATLPRFQAEVGEIEAALAGALTLVEALAERVDAGDRRAAETSGAAKLIGTRAAIGAVERAVALIGNNALTRRNPLERHLRDVLCSRVHTPQDDTITASLGAAALARPTDDPAKNRPAE
ncbi:ccyl-CoA dehydrogenase type 2 domain protein [Catenulispora acidiphila DSM 44928]|uniref:Ccyl-CoA dehydrogenase type 2 domain protein n=1 Tax=Catenulispora acidiphila (strain DSM 44928 / JCM 14897 / NBRC 102108 / NRRL B-24433 / ID139908) TaxID=479433 RepID=C7Q108_CATAD|nr:acyl-CoA dehydrogenase family protein [Catenulispora acidiphila]ACU71683.1 ccyl-CoA dehydrogenase type 2 domain protein [Catenulispora acidiphila DSM 44928]